MNDREYNRLQDKILRGQLTTAEQERLEALLARHPELMNLSDDLALNQLLEQLPDAPISSNFTSRVLKAVEMEERNSEPTLTRFWTFAWVRSAVAASVVVASVMLTLHSYQQRERAEVAVSVTRISEVTTTTLPAREVVEMLKDFEAISRLGQMSTVDYELLAMQ